jgi:hypothetical protein
MWTSETVREVPTVTDRREVNDILQFHTDISLHYQADKIEDCNRVINAIIDEYGLYDGVILVNSIPRRGKAYQLWW